MNLFSGCLGIAFVFEGHLELSSVCILIAALFDFFDGMAARMLNVRSALGMQLDSLADLVSFGVLPATILFYMMKSSYNLPEIHIAEFNITPFSAYLLPLFSAWRLGKFNIDTRQTESFLGLPTPASGILFGSFPLMILNSPLNENYAFIPGLLSNFYFLLAMIILVCILLVSELPLISLKFKNIKWSYNKYRYILLLIGLILIIALGFAAVPVVIAMYIILSTISYFRN
jgi:CDP-diacylglycerol--serine O-phosphatidyltransferase